MIDGGREPRQLPPPSRIAIIIVKKTFLFWVRAGRSVPVSAYRNAHQNFSRPPPLSPGRIPESQGLGDNGGGLEGRRSMTPGEWPKHLYGHIPRRVLKCTSFPRMCFNALCVYMLFNVKPCYERLRGSSVLPLPTRKGAAAGSKSRVEGETTTTTSSSHYHLRVELLYSYPLGAVVRA